ncbi:hypothetical protein C2G38_2139018 [Gigaspora rosea]|uniref:Uncharacterized protein n=1 Tax=Gigaspora rosea TaxID=44941 RepID=A0A397VT39_9GLOM|nr:hypothetical protein C2G38_2139018 [Gigaspora rosea]
MPDFIVRKTMKLRNIVEDPYLFFEKELLENINLLEDHQLNELILDLERGTKKALELHQKWLDCWLHLLLSICHLGVKYGHEFARSFAFIILKMPWSSVPTLRELCYVKFLETDVEYGEFNDFGKPSVLKSVSQNIRICQISDLVYCCSPTTS